MGEFTDLVRKVYKAPSSRILVVGDLMLDRYIFGLTKRRCPEAPAPIVEPYDTEESLGGAGNAAANLKALGAGVSVFGAVGFDEAGDVVGSLLSDWNTAWGKGFVGVRHPGVTTTVKRRTYVDDELCYREDREEPLSREAYAVLLEALQSRVRPDYDAILVSDYAKGVVGHDVLMVLKDAGVPVYADPKRSLSFYQGVRAVFPNHSEATASRLEDFGEGCNVGLDDSVSAYLEGTAKSVPMFEILAVTLGAAGAFVGWRTGVESPRVMTHTVKARAEDVADVCGAGDTFAAAFVLADLAGLSPLEAAKFANLAAGVSVGTIGALPVSWDDLFTGAAREDENGSRRD